jgi:hypothetical protein
VKLAGYEGLKEDIASRISRGSVLVVYYMR